MFPTERHYAERKPDIQPQSGGSSDFERNLAKCEMVHRPGVCHAAH